VVTARHVADATDRVGRRNLWRLAEMALAGGDGRLYLEFLVSRRRSGDRFARREHLRPLVLARVAEDLESNGATVVASRHAQESGPDDPSGHRIGRLVVEWRR
jgi:hypothetical protein